MTRVAVNPAAAAAVDPGRTGGRSASAVDGARFEVAIRSQLESGRGPRPSDRVDPADPRGRSTISERNQRPTPDTVFERPDRSGLPDRPVRDRPERPVHSGHPARLQRPARETSPAAGVVAPASQPASDATAARFAVHSATATGAEVVAAAGPAPEPAVPTAATTAIAMSVTSPGAAQPATPPSADQLGTDHSPVAGVAAGVAPATQPEATSATDARAAGTNAPAPTAGIASQDPAAADPSVSGRSSAGEPGAGQSGAGESGSGHPATGHPGADQPSSPAQSPVNGGDAGVAAATTPDLATATPPVLAGIPAAVVDATTTTAAAAAASVTASAPTTGTATAMPEVPASVPNPVIPLPPQAQVLSAMSPLLTGSDGTHRVTVHLEPENLGKVRVQLSLRGGEVAVHLIAADAATRETLRQGLPELRAQLEQSGLRTAGMDVQSGSADLFGREAGTGAGTGAGGGTGGGAAPGAGHGAIPGHRASTSHTALPTPDPTARSLSHDVALDVRM